MSNRFFRSVLVVLAACTLLLGGCSDFDEMKGKRLLSQAQSLIQQGDESQAEQVLADLVARYPETQSGMTASRLISQINQQRTLREREVFAKILASYQQVLSGFHTLYAEYPRSLSALDQSDYFFNSAYLEEILPDGYQAYLWLKSDGSGYRIWCVARDNERGYATESKSLKLVPFERDEILNKIAIRFQSNAWESKLVALQLQN